MRELEFGAGVNIPPIRMLDLCAGLGGFAYGAQLAVERSEGRLEFMCLMASELDEELRELYVINHSHDSTLRDTYRQYYPPEACVAEGMGDLYDSNGELRRVHGQIEWYLQDGRLRKWESGPRKGLTVVPDHDLLCAGFPCQPFSKSGYQRGFSDSLNGRGTVWESIWAIISEKEPEFVLLENVGNFERHDGGRTWQRVRDDLSGSYEVVATTHISSEGGGGLLSPHHLGFPHHRERFFICAQHKRSGGFRGGDLLARLRRPTSEARRHLDDTASTRLRDILETSQATATSEELNATRLSGDQESCISQWQELLSNIGELPFEAQARVLPMPSFPIWGFELDPWHHYPFETSSPCETHDDELRAYRDETRSRARRVGLLPPLKGHNVGNFGEYSRPLRWRAAWPSYTGRDEWPEWKIRFIRHNREWSESLLDVFGESGRLVWYRSWLDRLAELTPSHQKLEWNCQGEELDLRVHILQFRPSGLRVKRFRHVPALVASTATQIPVVPTGAPDRESREMRFLLPSEGCLLQGLPRDWELPKSRNTAFKALGNAVHAEVVAAVLREWLTGGESTRRDTRQLALSSEWGGPG